MQITPVNSNSYHKNIGFGAEPSFKHQKDGDNYTVAQKSLVAVTSAMGVTAAMAVLAKCNKMKLFTKYKDSYFKRADYADWKPIVSIGAGSILGGLAGGYMIDKNKENRKAKCREAFMQMGNVSIPILVVHITEKYLFKNASKLTQAFAAIGAVFAGVALANFTMNKSCNFIFNNKNERGVKLADYSAHVDDLVAAAGYISQDGPIRTISKIIPFALMIPGNEVGRKTL